MRLKGKNVKLEEIEKLLEDAIKAMRGYDYDGCLEFTVEFGSKLVAVAKAAKMVCVIAGRERWEAIEHLKRMLEELEKE